MQDRSFTLRYAAEALQRAAGTYENILNSDIVATPELKKAVQSTIVELCTVVCDFVKED